MKVYTLQVIDKNLSEEGIILPKLIDVFPDRFSAEHDWKYTYKPTGEYSDYDIKEWEV